MSTQSAAARGSIHIDVHPPDADPARELAALKAGLLAEPPEIAPRYLYDDTGAALFERICELPEYYQTRTERALLGRIAAEVVARTGAAELVELGSGASQKTRVLLDAMEAAGHMELYVPLDVNEGIVRRAAGELVARYPTLRVHGVVGDFLADLGNIPAGGRRLVLFLGGTIGNFRRAQAVAFLARLARALSPGDALLLGTDLIKAPARIEAAYNDRAGVTAAFNRNILRVVNERAGGDFDPRRFEHRAFYVPEAQWIEMRLRATADHVVRLEALDLELKFTRGREILTEISAKHDRPLAEKLLHESGFALERWYVDPEQLFALSLARVL